MQILLLIIIAGVLLGGGYFWYSQQSTDDLSQMNSGIIGLTPPPDSDVPINSNTGTTNTKSPPAPSNTNKPAGVIQEFTFSNQGFTFTPAAFAVKKGDHVKVTFKNTGGTHDFRIEGYEVGTNVIQTGGSQTFEFTADKSGTFEFYCSVGNHRGMGMKGAFTVTE